MSASTQALLDSIAYVAWHGHEVLEERLGRVRIAQAGRENLLNYMGTAHAGAVFTLAETAGGVVADRLARQHGCFILLRSATANYLRRASGRLVATGEVDAAAAAALERLAGKADRTGLNVQVRIDDDSGQAVFEGSFQYVLKMRKS